MGEAGAHVQVIEETPAYWRVVFDYPPFNIVDASIFEALQYLLARMDANPSLRVVVFVPEPFSMSGTSPIRSSSDQYRQACNWSLAISCRPAVNVAIAASLSCNCNIGRANHERDHGRNLPKTSG